MANDPNVDLVVSSVRVDSHADTISPSMRAGKDVYVEWPLEANLAKATEVYDLGHQVRTIIGLQARFSPILQKLKHIVQSGRIGKIKCSTFIANESDFGPFGKKTVAYFADREVGGNIMTIHFGHTIQYITEGTHIHLPFVKSLCKDVELM